ncbi:hypothetical protein IW262DRAFT_777131 [Armillaria fumosa]|nr:hypothetical protein IW262DRAFT_777131 [Armillaria fumosa]
MDEDDERMLMDDDPWQIVDGDDWWRTSYTAVSWAPSTTTAKKVAVLPPLTVDDQSAIHDDMDLTLSCSLPGVQAALGALGRYEADVGFYFSQSSEAIFVWGHSNICLVIVCLVPWYPITMSISVHLFRRIYYVRTKYACDEAQRLGKLVRAYVRLPRSSPEPQNQDYKGRPGFLYGGG